MLETRRTARSVRIRGVVQGVGFRPFVFRLARANNLKGWVLNEGEGVDIHLEGPEPGLDAFLQDLVAHPPPAASIASIDVHDAMPTGATAFEIRHSELRARPVTRISPDLPICPQCREELFDPGDPRCGYPYINCTECGPRFSILLALPYDRHNTTMRAWPMDDYCASQYRDPEDRRFHAQPVACPHCGPHYRLVAGDDVITGDTSAIRRAAELLEAGAILAAKGIGGYHLVCDARDAGAVVRLRERKYRKEKPFAVMARDLDVARTLVDLDEEASKLLTSPARPIVLARANIALDAVAPDTRELGVMLPYAPLHHLLFAAGAPDALVMTSGNRSSEPIAFTDEDARSQLHGIADAFLMGERPIARRVDDSVVRAGALGPVLLRRARGYAPGAVARIPVRRPVLALGADLKNTIALAVDGEVMISQHIGDLDHFPAFQAFRETVRDLLAMYDVNPAELTVVHDGHPEYQSTRSAPEFPAARRIAIQHHHAHAASVLAEYEAWDTRALAIVCDGTGYGDDGVIWGCEIFAGSVREGFTRVAHLRPAALVGGDAAAQFPVQAATGFLAQMDAVPDLTAQPYLFPERYRAARRVLDSGVRVFTTTSMGRLFDAAAALTGYTRGVTFEGQPAMWLEQLARGSARTDAYAFPLEETGLDFRPLLQAVMRDRSEGRVAAGIARAFHLGVAQGLADAARLLAREHECGAIVLSGGVFQNELLMEQLRDLLSDHVLWTNHSVPANDGGISLGQAALAAFLDPTQE